MRARIARKCLFPIKERLLARKTPAVLRALDRSQWYSKEQLRELQWSSLRALLDHCYHSSPYYREQFEILGAEPGDFCCIEDFSSFPILTKEDLRARMADLYSTEPDGRMCTVRTSGSTGEPVSFRLSAVALSYHLANMIRGRRWWGIDIGDRELRLWGDRSPFDRSVSGRLLQQVHLLKDRALAVHIRSAFELSERYLMESYRILIRERPRILFGYGTALYVFADFIRDHALSIDGAAPVVAMYTSETLYPNQRQLIEEVFGCRLVSEYGSVEAGVMANECQNGSLHLADETILTEIEGGESAADGAGYLVVTHLRSFGLPLLRYRIGDVGSLSTERCSCGRELSVMKSLVGRDNDLIRRPNGEYVHPELFDYIMRYQPAVRKYRIVETGPGQITVKLETRRPLTSSEGAKLEKQFTEHLGDMHVELSVVDHLSPDPSGKFRWVVGRGHVN